MTYMYGQATDMSCNNEKVEIEICNLATKLNNGRFTDLHKICKLNVPISAGGRAIQIYSKFTGIMFT